MPAVPSVDPAVDQPVVRLAELREAPLDVAEVLAALAHPAAGGVDLFAGIVRDHDHDQSVVGLEYSAHPTAAAQLHQVASQVAARFDVRAVAVVHRVGPLRVGDAAVLLGTAAEHRAEAFAATRALIDELKATVPIWKHQLFGDGTDEWVGTP